MTTDEPSRNPAYVRDTLSDDWKDIGFVDERLPAMIEKTVTPGDRPLVVEVDRPHDFAELQRRRLAEADLNFRLIEDGAARIVANPDGRGVEIVLDRRAIKDPKLARDLLLARVNANLTAQGVGPRLMGKRSPGPEPVAVVEGPRACPDCLAGKHDNCDGSAWDLRSDASCPCPCAQAGHS